MTRRMTVSILPDRRFLVVCPAGCLAKTALQSSLAYAIDLAVDHTYSCGWWRLRMEPT